MMSAVDFGGSVIRCLFRDPAQRNRLKMFAERSEYAVIPRTEEHIRSLTAQQIPFADCEGSLAVVGNAVDRADWLSRVPLTPLFDEGQVPDDDPPARQMLNVLLESMLPRISGPSEPCAVILPIGNGSSDQRLRNERFLCRLVSMLGYEPIPVHPAAAAVLSTGLEDTFTSGCVVLGAQSSAVSIARLGIPLAERRLPVGCNGIDLELAREFRVHTYDTAGTCYLDLEQIRRWRTSGHVHLRDPLSSKESRLVRLYTVLLDRVTGTIAELLQSRDVTRQLGVQRIPITVCGGPAAQPGFAGLFTERLIEHDIAKNVTALRIADQPETAVVRGGLILAELEARRLRTESRAA